MSDDLPTLLSPSTIILKSTGRLESAAPGTTLEDAAAIVVEADMAATFGDRLVRPALLAGEAPFDGSEAGGGIGGSKHVATTHRRDRTRMNYPVKDPQKTWRTGIHEESSRGH